MAHKKALLLTWIFPLSYACQTTTETFFPDASTADASMAADASEVSVDAAFILADRGPSGGTLTVHDVSRDAFSRRSPATSPSHRSTFVVGNSFFSQSWVVAPASTTAIDGLGPLFNARSCAGCHFKDGRGQPRAAPEAQTSALVRVGEDGRDRFGTQIQPFAMPTVPVEADVLLHFTDALLAVDGGELTLNRPHVSILVNDVAVEVETSLRVAPAVFGDGLLEAVSNAELLEREDPNDLNGDGISGRASWVSDPMSGHSIGRFGWRAAFASLHGQSAAAFTGDMGLTTTIFPDLPCTAAQTECRTQIDGGSPEVADGVLADVVDYMRLLGVPAQRTPTAPEVVQGRELFFAFGCESCHREVLHTPSDTALPELLEQTFYPYTDLLLHDMGEALGDNVQEGIATRNEWRTAPLWGLGLVPTVNGHSTLLHDGRARGFDEAILWHGGEAARARARYRESSAADRAAVVRFLESL